jgi:hypothetical protein
MEPIRDVKLVQIFGVMGVLAGTFYVLLVIWLVYSLVVKSADSAVEEWVKFVVRDLISSKAEPYLLNIVVLYPRRVLHVLWNLKGAYVHLRRFKIVNFGQGRVSPLHEKLFCFRLVLYRVDWSNFIHIARLN